MTETVMARLFAHNDWANDALIEACAALPDTLLDAPPPGGRGFTVRETLTHFVEAQQSYVSLLTVPPEERRPVSLAWDELATSVARSGVALRAIARDVDAAPRASLRTLDGYDVEPWVVLLQVVNHATDHRRQVVDRLRALGVVPPRLDGWAFGEITGALVARGHHPQRAPE